MTHYYCVWIYLFYFTLDLNEKMVMKQTRDLETHFYTNITYLHKLLANNSHSINDISNKMRALLTIFFQILPHMIFTALVESRLFLILTICQTTINIFMCQREYPCGIHIWTQLVVSNLIKTHRSANVHINTHVASQRRRDAIITSLLRQNEAVMSFWRDNVVIIASCVRWDIPFMSTDERSLVLKCATYLWW